jgi:hypothetical protein
VQNNVVQTGSREGTAGKKSKGKDCGENKRLETFLSTDKYKTETMTEEDITIQIANRTENNKSVLLLTTCM